jgi:hypothetical protein
MHFYKLARKLIKTVKRIMFADLKKKTRHAMGTKENLSKLR